MTPARPTPSAPLLASGPADLLALVPYRLGFHPADSVLLLELLPADPRTGRRSLGLVVRGDLPPAAAARDPGTLDVAARAAAEACLRLVRRAVPPGSQVLVVLHDPDARATPEGLRPGPRASSALAAVRSGLAELRAAGGPDPGDHLLVGAGRWRTLTCSRPCCPPHGEPWPADGPAGALRVRAEAVWRGLSAAPDRAASLPPSTPADPARCAAAAAARAEPVPPAEARALVAAFDHAVEQARTGPAPALDAAWCGRLLRALERVEVRDALLLSGCSGPSTAPARRHLLSPPGAAPPAAGAGWLGRALVEDADPVRASVAAGIAVQVARCGGTGGGAQAWAVAAWLEWAAGRSARAGACAGHALARAPGHRLAALVERAVRDGLGPPAAAGRTGAGGPPTA